MTDNEIYQKINNLEFEAKRLRQVLLKREEKKSKEASIKWQERGVETYFRDDEASLRVVGDIEFYFGWDGAFLVNPEQEDPDDWMFVVRDISKEIPEVLYFIEVSKLCPDYTYDETVAYLTAGIGLYLKHCNGEKD